MHRLSHLLHHLNQNNQHHIRNNVSITGPRLSATCDVEIANCCANLCNWIYNVAKSGEQQLSLPVHPHCNKSDDPGWNIRKFQKGEYSILSPKISTDTLFIVFAGTPPNDNPLQVAVDLCAAHQPLRDVSNPSKQVAHVHSAIYGNMRRYFDRIHNSLSPTELKRHGIKRIIITGHSLGGGLATLFAYNTLRFKKHFNDIKLDVITFGAPMVFAVIRDHFMMDEMAKICHNFVNSHDPIPRLPGATEWVQNVLPSIGYDFASHKNGNWKYIGNVPNEAKDLMNAFVNKINESGTIQVFSEYFPVGTYYFIGDKADISKMTISSDTNMTKKRLYRNPFESGKSYPYDNFIYVVEQHYMKRYIDSLQKVSSTAADVVSPLRSLENNKDNIDKEELIPVLRDSSKHETDELLKGIKQILSENEQNEMEKYSQILKMITKHYKTMEAKLNEIGNKQIEFESNWKLEMNEQNTKQQKELIEILSNITKHGTDDTLREIKEMLEKNEKIGTEKYTEIVDKITKQYKTLAIQIGEMEGKQKEFEPNLKLEMNNQYKTEINEILSAITKQRLYIDNALRQIKDDLGDNEQIGWGATFATTFLTSAITVMICRLLSFV